MPINSINWSALDKFNTATTYAQNIKNHPAGGGAIVVHLQNSQRLVCNYSQTDAPKSLFNSAFSRTDEEKRLNNETRETFKQIVIDIFGKSIDEVPKKVRDAMNLNKFDGIGRPLTARRIIAVNKAINAEMVAMAKKFGITGGAAGDIMSTIVSDSDILQSPNPDREFKAIAKRNATASIATHIATCASNNLDYRGFELDIVRGMGLKLGGRRVPADPAVARDMIARFLVGSDSATFAGLDEPMRRKACILMSLLHQGSIACFMTGVSSAFDHNAQVARLSLGATQDGSQFNSFAVTKDRAGNITIKGQVTFSGQFLVNMSNGSAYMNKMTDSNGVIGKYEGTIKLPAADLDKFANADWTKYDGRDVVAMDNDYNTPDRFRKAADMIPEEYRFSGSVDVSMKLHVNQLHEI